MNLITQYLTASFKDSYKRLKTKEDFAELKDRVDAFYSKYGHYNISHYTDSDLTLALKKFKQMMHEKRKYVVIGQKDLISYFKSKGVLDPRTNAISEDEILDMVYSYYKKYSTYNVEQRKDKRLYNILLNIKKGRRRVSHSLKRRLDSLTVQNKKKSYKIFIPNSRKVNENSVRKLLILYFDKYKNYDVVNRMGFTGLYSFILKVKNNKVDISRNLREELQDKGII